jgi:nitrate reductase alpha subunit
MPQAVSISEGDAVAVASHRAKSIDEEHIQREIKYFRDFAAIYTDAPSLQRLQGQHCASLPAAADGADPHPA